MMENETIYSLSTPYEHRYTIIKVAETEYKDVFSYESQFCKGSLHELKVDIKRALLDGKVTLEIDRKATVLGNSSDLERVLENEFR